MVWHPKGERTKVASNSHATIWSVPVQKDGAKDEPFLIVERKHAVAVYIRNEEGKVLLVQQHRFAGDKIGWEIPQGAIEDGEDPLEASGRELLEEANVLALEAGSIVGEVYEAADWCTSKCSVVAFASVQTRTKGSAELNNRWFSDEEIVELISKGELFDAMTLAALHLCSLHR